MNKERVINYVGFGACVAIAALVSTKMYKDLDTGMSKMPNCDLGSFAQYSVKNTISCPILDYDIKQPRDLTVFRKWTPAKPAQKTTFKKEYNIHTAVYDIKAHTVYLPNGTSLEAHSGRGEMFDNPNYVHLRDRGPTPPHVYKLSYRERLFHGVVAIRLIPNSTKDVFHRDGFLAHPYFLGARGDSKGCVSFKNYATFLHAFERGEITELAVVSSLD